VRTFRDTEGREWVLALTLGSLRRIKASAGLDMLDLGQWDKEASNPFLRLSRDAVTLADTLCALCQTQMVERGISEERFAESLGGQSIDDALIALVEEWSDFFRQGRREMESMLLRRALEVLTETRAKMTQAIAVMDREMTVEKILSASRTNSPESSESTPAPSLSAN